MAIFSSVFKEAYQSKTVCLPIAPVWISRMLPQWVGTRAGKCLRTECIQLCTETPDGERGCDAATPKAQKEVEKVSIRAGQRVQRSSSNVDTSGWQDVVTSCTPFNCTLVTRVSFHKCGQPSETETALLPPHQWFGPPILFCYHSCITRCFSFLFFSTTVYGIMYGII